MEGQQPGNPGQPTSPEASPKKGGGKSVIAFIVVIILVALAWFAFGRGGSEDGNLEAGAALGVSADAAEVIAVVNGDEITKGEYDRRRTQTELIASQSGADLNDEEVAAAISTQAIDDLIAETLILQAATADGFSASDSDVEAEIAATETQLGGEEAFEAVLETQGFTRDSFFNTVREQLTIQQYLRSVVSIDSVTASDEEIEALYDSVAATDPENTPALEDVRPQVEAQVVANKTQALLLEYVSGLRTQASIEISL